MRQKRLYAMSVVLALVLALLPYAATPAEAATYTVNTTSDRDSTCGDGGLCSLREAINAANSNLGADTIAFNISGCGGVCTLTLSSSLPPLQDTSGGTTIDGTTQTTNQGDTNPDGPEIEIDCSNSSDHCLQINSASNIIKGLVINRCPYDGVRISDAEAVYNKVLGCYIGTDATGESDSGNNGSLGFYHSLVDAVIVPVSGVYVVFQAVIELAIGIELVLTDDPTVEPGGRRVLRQSVPRLLRR